MFDALFIARPLLIAALAFGLSVALMPVLIRFLKVAKMGKSIRASEAAPIMSALHQAKAGVPTMGGIAVWGTVLFLVLVLEGACLLVGKDHPVCALSFLSRRQTWLPLALMLGAALIGLVDDYWNVKRIGSKGGGLSMRHRLLSYTLIAVIGALWFYTKLEWDQLHIPFLGTYIIGWWYVPFFILTVVATSFSVNETDGLDGLAGGTLLASFGAYAIIAWSQGRTDLATLCGAIIGGLLGFLWYNVNPADIFIGDTGAMSLGTVLAVVALLTNQPLLLPLIGIPFVIESASVLLQTASKKLRGKKIFQSTPIHHHFEAKGWKEQRIVMRFWMLSWVFAAVGVVLALIDKL